MSSGGGRRHFRHEEFRVPAVFGALQDLVRDLGAKGDLDLWRFLCCSSIYTAPVDLVVPEDDSDAIELSYLGQPIEIVPFGWEGGDALHYGWAVLAPELDLDDQPCVSFAPIDGRACWLGDNTKQALENLLVGAMANWTEWDRQGGRPSPADDPLWTILCRELDLHPEIGSPHITAGARSNRAIQPAVPSGWCYEPTDDGIGVLADESAFAPYTVEFDAFCDEENIVLAQRSLADGYPADALCILKETKSTSAQTDELVMRTMREAYQALGRTMHVERADIWLRFNSSDPTREA